jgi:hypothetical protein
VKRRRGELSEFVADVLASLARQDQRRWGECHLRGLLLDGRRKSIQPMPERLPDGNMQALPLRSPGKEGQLPIAVSVHAATDTASCLREGSCAGVGGG